MRVLFSQAHTILVKNRTLKNIPFYLLITSLIASIHILHVFLNFHDKWTVGSQLILTALLESVIEGFLFCYLASFCEKSRILQSLVIIVAAFFPVIHLIDFILERLFNLSFWHTVYSFFSESLENMLELLLATNLPLWSWALGFLALFGIGGVFLGLYTYIERRFSSLKGIKDLKSYSAFVAASFCLWIPLKSSFRVGDTLNFHIAKVLPFKGALYGKSDQACSIDFVKNSFSSESISSFSIGDNLFIFVIESLRHDAVNSETAPYLSSLGDKHFRHPYCVAGANGTHLSWFSLFFSQPSFAWKSTSQNGSPFFKELKQQGFDVRVFASARMSYYDMDKQLFGTNYECVDEYFCPKLEKTLTAYEADKSCFEHLKQAVCSRKGKQAYIIFLDATHFGYSLPQDAAIKFAPHHDSIPYISSVFAKKGIEGIKNRYFNTIYALDRLFEDFDHELKKQGLFDNSCLLITADHGEEFYEKGQLFHASHLSNEQLHIPLIVKAPSEYKHTFDDRSTMSHVTMCDFLKSILSNKPYEGQSWQTASRFNFSLSPEEVVIMSKEGKALYRLDEKQQKLFLKGVFDAQDKPCFRTIDVPETIILKDL